MSNNDVLARVRAAKRITADDAMNVRRTVYGNDGAIRPDEMDAMFVIDEAADRVDPAWTRLLVEAATDFIVHQQAPSGYIDDANADWLIARIGKDGTVKTATELELLVKVLEEARSSPEKLVRYALRQVQNAVVDGKGPLADGTGLVPGHVDRGEVALIRRILYAFGGDNGIAITRSEAEVLFDINDRTAEAQNDPEWTDLFVKAIANCMMAASGYTVPPREVALRREEWLDSPNGGVGDFFARMVSGGLRGVIAAYTMPSGENARAAMNARLDAAIAANEIVNEEEAGWLAARIGRDGKLHRNEKALLRFIHDEAPEVHPTLKRLVDQAA
jgi:hypothetical protein